MTVQLLLRWLLKGGVTLGRQVSLPRLPARSVSQPLRSPCLRSNHHSLAGMRLSTRTWIQGNWRNWLAGCHLLGSFRPRKPWQLWRTCRTRSAHRLYHHPVVRAKFQHSLWVEVCVAGVHARLTCQASPFVRLGVLQVAAASKHIHLIPQPHQRRQPQ